MSKRDLHKKSGSSVGKEGKKGVKSVTKGKEYE
jgi:hypothetical protein